MPRYAKPPSPIPDAVETAIETIGNRASLSILRWLVHHGPATTGDIATALEIKSTTVRRHLRILEPLGMITADEDRDERHGRRVKYSVVMQKVDEHIDQLRNYVHGY